MERSRLAVLILMIVVAGLLLIGCGSASEPPERAAGSPPLTSPRAGTSPGPRLPNVELVDDPLDVPYVPTPTEVVARMLTMAGVNKNDLLYDLGSGDGRIVITAAREYGARGIGYDLNPKRIKESNENARKAGVENQVKFIQKDLFEANLKGATVVTLYLLPEVNLRLKPKLLRELRPGTRIVSHNYDMGDWKAEAVEQLNVRGTAHYIYFWTVPEKSGADK